jgi:hypothetical protein
MSKYSHTKLLPAQMYSTPINPIFTRTYLDIPVPSPSNHPLLEADPRPLNVTHKISTTCLHPPPRYQCVLRTVHPDQQHIPFFSSPNPPQDLPRSNSSTPRDHRHLHTSSFRQTLDRVFNYAPARTVPYQSPRHGPNSFPDQHSPAIRTPTEPPIPSTARQNASDRSKPGREGASLNLLSACVAREFSAGSWVVKQ